MSSTPPPYFVYVDSRKRNGYPQGSDSSFSYTMNFPPGITYNRVTVVDLLCPKSYYLVNSSNTFQLKEVNTTVTISVPQGCYLLSTFKSQISSLLTAASPNGWTYVVSYPTSGADTGMFTYTCSNNTSQPSLIFNNLFFEPFGFFPSSTNTFTSNTITSTCVIKLQAEDRLILHCSLIDNPNTDDVLLSFNSTSSVNYSSISYVNYAPKETARRLKNDASNTATFNLTDESGNLINLNNLNQTFTLMFFWEPDYYDILTKFVKLHLLKE